MVGVYVSDLLEDIVMVLWFGVVFVVMCRLVLMLLFSMLGVVRVKGEFVLIVIELLIVVGVIVMVMVLVVVLFELLCEV